MSPGQSEIPELFNEYREALRENDLPKAIGRAVKIDEAEAEVMSLLDDFATAVQNDDIQLANTILVKIDEVYDELAADEEAQAHRAIEAVETAQLSESERADLLALTQQTSKVNLLRSTFLNEAIGYLKSGADSSSTDVASTAEQTKSAESDLEASQSQETVQTVNNDTSLSSSPTILDSNGPTTVVQTDSANVEVVVGNVGDAPTDALTLSAAGVNNTTVNPTETTLNQLDPHARKTITFDVKPTTTGTGRVEVKLKQGQTEISSTANEFTISENASSIRKAITGAANGTPGAAEIQQAISYWARDGTIPETGGKSVSTEKLQEFITDWLQKSGGNQ